MTDDQAKEMKAIALEIRSMFKSLLADSTIENLPDGVPLKNGDRLPASRFSGEAWETYYVTVPPFGLTNNEVSASTTLLPNTYNYVSVATNLDCLLPDPTENDGSVIALESMSSNTGRVSASGAIDFTGVNPETGGHYSDLTSDAPFTVFLRARAGAWNAIIWISAGSIILT